MSAPTSASPAAQVLLCTAPAEGGHAERLARGLVEAELAACVNLVGPVRSIYRWQGAVAEDPELLLVIKTRAACYADVEAYLLREHPYEVPEVIALDVTRGSEAYLAWLGAQVG